MASFIPVANLPAIPYPRVAEGAGAITGISSLAVKNLPAIPYPKYTIGGQPQTIPGSYTMLPVKPLPGTGTSGGGGGTAGTIGIGY